MLSVADTDNCFTCTSHVMCKRDNHVVVSFPHLLVQHVNHLPDPVWLCYVVLYFTVVLMRFYG